jgi:putative transposase
MKKSKLSDTQIVSILNENAAGITVVDLCRKYGIAKSTFYKLKGRYGDMSVPKIKQLKSLEEENRKLKQMYADSSLDNRILKDILGKKFPGLLDKVSLKK